MKSPSDEEIDKFIASFWFTNSLDCLDIEYVEQVLLDAVEHLYSPVSPKIAAYRRISSRVSSVEYRGLTRNERIGTLKLIRKYTYEAITEAVQKRLRAIFDEKRSS